MNIYKLFYSNNSDEKSLVNTIKYEIKNKDMFIVLKNQIKNDKLFNKLLKNKKKLIIMYLSFNSYSK